MVHEHVVAGIATALRAGALTADAVALEARKWGEADQDTPRRRVDGGATVTSMTERRLAALPPDPRPPRSPRADEDGAVLRECSVPFRPAGRR
ncbi:hypothetical protein [Streptomyces sp. NBC_00459]|uniref:hypothetical protein n=1 Tax=Streptomyces sp. NBC_00459 TaxID=2975749 RepID=UPI002E1866F7